MAISSQKLWELPWRERLKLLDDEGVSTGLEGTSGLLSCLSIDEALCGAFSLATRGLRNSAASMSIGFSDALEAEVERFLLIFGDRLPLKSRVVILLISLLLTLPRVLKSVPERFRTVRKVLDLNTVVARADFLLKRR